MDLRRIYCKFVCPALVLTYLFATHAATGRKQVQSDLHSLLLVDGAFFSGASAWGSADKRGLHKSCWRSHLSISGTGDHGLIASADQSRLKDVVGVLALPLQVAFSCKPNSSNQLTNPAANEPRPGLFVFISAFWIIALRCASWRFRGRLGLGMHVRTRCVWRTILPVPYPDDSIIRPRQKLVAIWRETYRVYAAIMAN